MLGHGPISGTPICALHHWSVYVLSTTELESEGSETNAIYAATRPFISRVADQPPNQPFLGTLEASFVMSRSIVSSDGYHGYVLNVSELSLINDGTYDLVHDENSVNGQRIVVRIGEATGRDTVGPYSEFETLAELIGVRWRADRKRLTVEGEDSSAKLNVPALPSVYAGTGELEGGTELKGKRKPKGWGPVTNAPPSLVIAGELLFQIHDGEIDGISAVKDGGIALTFLADYATVALLRASAIVAGQYGTCIAFGFFRIGGAYKQITVDFTGDAFDGVYVETTADIVERVVLSATDLIAGDFDAWTFAKLNTDQPAARSYFLGSESSETVAQMATNLMRGIGGWHGMTTLGKLVVMRTEAPVEIASAYYNIKGGNLLDIDRTDLPQGVDPPPRRRRVTWAHNWTVQTEVYAQVSEGDPAQAAYLASPYKLTSTSEAASDLILSDYPFAPDPEPILGYFALEADAQAEAERIHTLYTSNLKPYRFTVKHALGVHQIGEVVNVMDSSINPRLQLAAGKYLRIVEANDNVRDGVTEMIGFG